MEIGKFAYSTPFGITPQAYIVVTQVSPYNGFEQCGIPRFKSHMLLSTKYELIKVAQFIKVMYLTAKDGRQNDKPTL